MDGPQTLASFENTGFNESHFNPENPFKDFQFDASTYTELANNVYSNQMIPGPSGYYGQYEEPVFTNNTHATSRIFTNSFHPYTKNTKRSETINKAFSAVKECIPNVSNDTKLSKIQTLRLAISYMRFLMSCLGDHRFLMLMDDSERELYKEFIKQDVKQKIAHNENEERDNSVSSMFSIKSYVISYSYLSALGLTEDFVYAVLKVLHKKEMYNEAIIYIYFFRWLMTSYQEKDGHNLFGKVH